MATGNVQGNVDRLRLELRSIRYNEEFDIQGLKDGNPAAFLPLLHYCLLGYSRLLARHLSGLGYELYAKSDLRFVESTLKLLRDEFSYRSALTVAQFLSRGFTERKLILLYDVVQLCKRKHNELWKDGQPAKVHRVHKTPPTSESEPIVRVVRETPAAAPLSAPKQAPRQPASQDASTSQPVVDSGQPKGAGSKVATLAARFRSPTEPPPLPEAFRKHWRRGAEAPSHASQASTSNPKPRPLTSKPESLTAPSTFRPTSQTFANSQTVPLPVDPGRAPVDYSNRPMSELLCQFRGAARRDVSVPSVSAQERAGSSTEAKQGEEGRGKSVLDGPGNELENGDGERKDISGVEPARLLAALQRQFDSSGNLVEKKKQPEKDGLARTASGSSDEDGPLSAEQLQELEDKNTQQIEELRTLVASLESKYAKMETEALKLKENLQAKITLLEGRIRFLEHAKAEKAKGASVDTRQQKAGPSSAGRPVSTRLLGESSEARRGAPDGQAETPLVQRKVQEATGVAGISKGQEKLPETSPIKANRGTKDFLAKMRARFEATQELLRSDMISSLR